MIYAQSYTQHTYLNIIIKIIIYNGKIFPTALLLQLTDFIPPSIIQLLIHRHQLIKFWINKRKDLPIRKRDLSTAGKIIGVEALIWMAALIFLALTAPVETAHFTICPFSAMGIDFCPGCGLGRSVSYVLHGEITNSLSLHPLGIFALIVLFTRIISLIKMNWSNYGKRISINARS